MNLESGLRSAQRFVRGRPRASIAVALGIALALVLALRGSAPTRVARAMLEPGSLARVESFAGPIRAAAAEFGLDPCLVAGIVYTESRGRVDAVSSAGALGLMQLTSAAVYDASRALEIAEPGRDQLLADAALNLRLGARHFAWTLANEERDVERALCAYNAGRARMGRWIEEAGGYARWRARQVRDGDSTVLAYALNVLEYAEEFRRRGVIAPAGGG